MFGTISDELEVNVPASEAWKLYSTLQLAEIVKEALPIVSQIDIVQGDGGPGTILQVHFSPAPGLFHYHQSLFNSVHKMSK